jgi:hypothetical protein
LTAPFGADRADSSNVVRGAWSLVHGGAGRFEASRNHYYAGGTMLSGGVLVGNDKALGPRMVSLAPGPALAVLQPPSRLAPALRNFCGLTGSPSMRVS